MNEKPIKGIVTVELFDSSGKRVQKEVSKNTVTVHEYDHIAWQLKRDFYDGHPSSALAEPLYPLNNIFLDFSYESQVYDDMYKNVGLIVGWSGKNTYAGDDTQRGTINPVESSSTYNRVHWVFDWATNAGNGTFNTIIWGAYNSGAYASLELNTFSGTSWFEPGGIACDGENLWSAYSRGDGNVGIRRININTRESVGMFVIPQSYWGSVTWCDGFLWSLTGSVRKINCLTGEVLATYDPPETGASGITCDGSYLWISTASGHFYKMDPNDFTIAGVITSPLQNSSDVTYCGDYLWVFIGSSPVIYKISPVSGQVFGMFSSGTTQPYTSSDIQAITSDNDYIWVKDSQYHSSGSRWIYYRKVYPVLGTISKMSNPVTKTNDKTMKVTYEFIFEE